MITCDLCLTEVDFQMEHSIGGLGINEVCEDCYQIFHASNQEISHRHRELVRAEHLLALKKEFPKAKFTEDS